MVAVEYNAFTTEGGKGNPAAVVFLGDEALDDGSMQRMARSFGFNETVFVSFWESTYRLRFFTPGHEVDLCGHATVAAVGFLNDRRLLKGSHGPVITNVGPLEVSWGSDADNHPRVTMEQGEPAFRGFGGSREALCGALGIGTDDLDASLPVVYGNTGIWTLLVPFRNVDTLKLLRPDTPRFPSILTELPRASVHPYCVERLAAENAVYARHFSSPYSQTIEDPVTGTASGVIGEFLLGANPALEALRFTVHQGHEMGRPGRVLVSVQRGRRVTITGNYVENGRLRPGTSPRMPPTTTSSGCANPPRG